MFIKQKQNWKDSKQTNKLSTLKTKGKEAEVLLTDFSSELLEETYYFIEEDEEFISTDQILICDDYGLAASVNSHFVN